MPLIALITDFGTQDAYVGIMKGVMAAIAPNLTYIDLTHAVPPQDLWAAQFHLAVAYPYFPNETVYLVVVDPGVGSDRRAVAVRFAGGTVVCPDNGILTGLLRRHPHESPRAVELTCPQYWRMSGGDRAQIGATFQGRDIFAPVAAHLASGVALEQVGQDVPPDSLVKLTNLVLSADGTSGVIQHIDRFGNLISTIPAAATSSHWVAHVGDRPIPSGKTYGSVPAGQLVSLIGSHGWVEIAANRARASDLLHAEVGQAVTVQLSQ